MDADSATDVNTLLVLVTDVRGNDVVVNVNGDVIVGCNVEIRGNVPVWLIGVALGVPSVILVDDVGAVVVRLGVVTDEVVGPETTAMLVDGYGPVCDDVVGVCGGCVGVPVGVDSVVDFAVGCVNVAVDVCNDDGTPGDVLNVRGIVGDGTDDGIAVVECGVYDVAWFSVAVGNSISVVGNVAGIEAVVRDVGLVGTVDVAGNVPV